jgi:hypothetical protein
MLMLAGKVTHNLCNAGWLFYLSSCQILADEKSSIQAFMTGRNRNNNIMFVGFVYTSHIYSFGYGDYFQRK